MSKKEEKKENSIVNNRNTSSFADTSLADDELQNNNYDDNNDYYSDRKTKREMKIELSIAIHNFLINYVSESDNLNIIPLCEYICFNNINEYLDMNNIE
jgi:hypothetical protein